MKKNEYGEHANLVKKLVSRPPETQKVSTKIQMTDGVLIPRKDDHHVFNSWRLTFIIAAGLLTF